MSLLFVSAPRISAGSFARVLTRANSPAAVDAANLYAIIVAYGLDPAVALAMFSHESSYGTAGVAHRSLNWGNLRSGKRASRVEAGFGFYSTFAESLRDWCDLIMSRYVARGLVTIEQAIPVYAPSIDGNAPARYIAAVSALVAAWGASEAAQVGLGPVSRIVNVASANVRSAPALGSNVVGSKLKGAAVGGLLVEGAAVAGSTEWLQIRAGQYMHSSVLV